VQFRVHTAFGADYHFLLCAVFGVVTLGIGRLMLVLRAQRLPSTQASLIDVLDVPLTPVWTLLFLGLVPTGHKIQGGDITIIAILIGIYVMEKSAEMPAN
jgi:drug/metabolite transporter (DMT)-like permease